jgi:hypothetical protein
MAFPEAGALAGRVTDGAVFLQKVLGFNSSTDRWVVLSPDLLKFLCMLGLSLRALISDFLEFRERYLFFSLQVQSELPVRLYIYS